MELRRNTNADLGVANSSRVTTPGPSKSESEDSFGSASSTTSTGLSFFGDVSELGNSPTSSTLLSTVSEIESEDGEDNDDIEAGEWFDDADADMMGPQVNEQDEEWDVCTTHEEDVEEEDLPADDDDDDDDDEPEPTIDGENPIFHVLSHEQ